MSFRSPSVLPSRSEPVAIDPGDEPSTKRRRISRACLQCRNRKIKCNGKEPSCDNCLTLNQTCTYTESKRRGLPPGYVMHLETYIKSFEMALGYIIKENSNVGTQLAEAVAKASRNNNTTQAEGFESSLQEAYRLTWKESDVFNLVQKLGKSVSTTGGPTGTMAPLTPAISSNSQATVNQPTSRPISHSPSAPLSSSDFTVNLPRTAVSGYPQYYGPSSIYERPSKPISLSLVLEPPSQSVSHTSSSNVAEYVRPAFEWLKSIPLSTKIDLANYYFFFVHTWIPIVDRELILDLIKATSTPQIPPNRPVDSLLHSSNIALITTFMALTMQMKQNQARPNSHKDTPIFDPNSQPKPTSESKSNQISDLNISTPSSTLISLCASVLPQHLSELGATTGSQKLIMIQSRLLYVLLLLRKGFNSDAWTEVGYSVRSAYDLGIHVYGVETFNDSENTKLDTNPNTERHKQKVRIKVENEYVISSKEHDNESDDKPPFSSKKSPMAAVSPPSHWTKRTWFACCILDTLVAAVLGRLPTVRDCDFEATSLLSTKDAWEEWVVLSEPCSTSGTADECGFVPIKPRKLFSEQGKLIVKDLKSSDLSSTVYGPSQAAWLAKPTRVITVYNSLFKLIRLLNIFLYRINKPTPEKSSNYSKSKTDSKGYCPEGDEYNEESDVDSDYITKPSDMYGDVMRNDFAQRVHKWSQNNLHTSCKKDVITYGIDGCNSCSHTNVYSANSEYGNHDSDSDNKTSPDLSLDCNNAHTIVMSPHALNLHLTFSAVLALMIRFDTISVLDCYDSSLPYAAYLMPTPPETGLRMPNPSALNGNVGGLAGNFAFGGDSLYGDINFSQSTNGATNGLGMENMKNPNGFSSAFNRNNRDFVGKFSNSPQDQEANNRSNFAQSKSNPIPNFDMDINGMTTGIVDLLNLDNGGFDFPGFESTGANPLSPADSSISTSSWNSWSSQPVYILPHSLPRHVTMKLTGYARFYTVHSAPPFFAYYSALALALAVDQFKSVAQSVAQSISRQQQQQHLGASVGFSNDVGANNPTKSFFGGLGGNVGGAHRRSGYNANTQFFNNHENSTGKNFMGGNDGETMGPDINNYGDEHETYHNAANGITSVNTAANISYLQSELSSVAGLIGITQSYYWVDSTWNLKGGTIRLESATIQKKRHQVDKTLTKLKRILFGVINPGANMKNVSNDGRLNRQSSMETDTNSCESFSGSNSNSSSGTALFKDNRLLDTSSGNQISASNACNNLININNSAALAMSIMGNRNKSVSDPVIGLNQASESYSPVKSVHGSDQIPSSNFNIQKSSGEMSSGVSGNSNRFNTQTGEAPQSTLQQNTATLLAMLEAAATAAANETNQGNLSAQHQQQIHQKLSSVMGILGMSNQYANTTNFNTLPFSAPEKISAETDMQTAGFYSQVANSHEDSKGQRDNSGGSRNAARGAGSVNVLPQYNGALGLDEHGHVVENKDQHDEHGGHVPEFLQNLGVMTE